jgi:formate dehydrogenase subunit gamma
MIAQITPQPLTFRTINMQALLPAQRETVRRQLTLLKSRPGPLIEILHAIQGELGFIPDGAVPLLAEELNLSRAEVHGVITFYHFFRRHPPGRHTIQVCRAESCQAMGGQALEAHAKQRLGVDFHETTPDGEVTLDPVFCLGNCSCSPAVMIDGELHGRVTPERFDMLLADLKGVR